MKVGGLPHIKKGLEIKKRGVDETEERRGRVGATMSEPILWITLGALAVQAALFLAKELHPVHFWVLTLFNWSCLFAIPYAIQTAYL